MFDFVVRLFAPRSENPAWMLFDHAARRRNLYARTTTVAMVSSVLILLISVESTGWIPFQSSFVPVFVVASLTVFQSVTRLAASFPQDLASRRCAQDLLVAPWSSRDFAGAFARVFLVVAGMQVVALFVVWAVWLLGFLLFFLTSKLVYFHTYPLLMRDVFENVPDLRSAIQILWFVLAMEWIFYWSLVAGGLALWLLCAWALWSFFQYLFFVFGNTDFPGFLLFAGIAPQAMVGFGALLLWLVAHDYVERLRMRLFCRE